MMFPVVTDLAENGIPVTVTCRVLNLCRQQYYRWLQEPMSDTELDEAYVANEGKLICICAAEDAQRVLQVMQNHPLGKQSAIIGEVVEDEHGFVQMETSFGGSRVVDWLAGEQLPRIC